MVHYNTVGILVYSSLQSANMVAYVKPQTRAKFGELGFCFASPDACNSVPSHLHFVTDTVAFKHKLKMNFLDKHLAIDWIHFISTSGIYQHFRNPVCILL